VKYWNTKIFHDRAATSGKRCAESLERLTADAAAPRISSIYERPDNSNAMALSPRNAGSGFTMTATGMSSR
jgi:hypothetical protein